MDDCVGPEGVSGIEASTISDFATGSSDTELVGCGGGEITGVSSLGFSSGVSGVRLCAGGSIGVPGTGVSKTTGSGAGSSGKDVSAGGVGCGGSVTDGVVSSDETGTSCIMPAASFIFFWAASKMSSDIALNYKYEYG